jgi:hypothetical protein
LVLEKPEVGRIRETALRRVDYATEQLDKLQEEVSACLRIAARVRAKLIAGESMGAIGSPCASDLDMQASRAARVLEGVTVLLSLGYDAEEAL